MLKKFIVNLFCGVFPHSETRKKIRTLLMKKHYKQNIICIAPNGHTKLVKNFKGISIDAQCDSCKVIIHEPNCFSNCHFEIKKNSIIEIFESKHTINNLHIVAKNNSTVKINKDFTCYGCFIEARDEEGYSVNIGCDCMFASGINIRTSDGHTIYDIDSKLILNRPKQGVNIGNHVWLGMHTKILKEVNLPDNTIVGAGSIVTKSFNKPNTILSGIPAKVIKENVNWNHQNTDYYEDNI